MSTPVDPDEAREYARKWVHHHRQHALDYAELKGALASDPRLQTALADTTHTMERFERFLGEYVSAYENAQADMDAIKSEVLRDGKDVLENGDVAEYLTVTEEEQEKYGPKVEACEQALNDARAEFAAAWDTYFTQFGLVD
jgi:hypothetical protein